MYLIKYVRLRENYVLISFIYVIYYALIVTALKAGRGADP